jgi:hypothetical protein
MDALWFSLFPDTEDALPQRIRLMGGIMVGVTFATTLTSVLVEVPSLGARLGPAAFATALAVRTATCLALSALSVLPFAVGAHAAGWTGRTRLLFSACLVVFFVGMALRAFLFFEDVEVRTRGGAGAEGALWALVLEPLGSAAAIGLLWGVLRARA